MNKDNLTKLSWDIRNITHDYKTHKLEVGDPDIKVGLIDSGVDITHPGIKTVTKSISMVDSDPNIDFTGHGTMIAGQISGSGLIPGIAPNIEIYSYKICDQSNKSSIANLKEALKLAMEDSVSIINMSIGFYYDVGMNSKNDSELKELKDIFNELYNKNIVCISSSGYNSDKTHYPSSLETVLSCQSLNKGYRKVNPDIESDFCIPSGDYDILKAKKEEFVPVYVPIILGENMSKITNLPLGYSLMNGESLSAAKLTGIVAILKSHYYKLNGCVPNNSTIKYILEISSSIIDGSYYPDLLKALEIVDIKS